MISNRCPPTYTPASHDNVQLIINNKPWIWITFIVYYDWCFNSFPCQKNGNIIHCIKLGKLSIEYLSSDRDPVSGICCISPSGRESTHWGLFAESSVNRSPTFSCTTKNLVFGIWNFRIFKIIVLLREHIRKRKSVYKIFRKENIYPLSQTKNNLEFSFHGIASTHQVEDKTRPEALFAKSSIEHSPALSRKW